jgi:hypothetical protein
MSTQGLGKLSYTAYGKVTDFKNFQGDPMPAWDDLPAKIREAWQAAAEAALKEGVGR